MPCREIEFLLKWKMNRYYHRTSALIILFTLICCGGKKIKPDPDEIVLDKKQPIEEIMVQKLSPTRPPAQFYKLEESIEDIQGQIAKLKAQVMEYNNQTSEANYIERLKELIDGYSTTHKITLKNGSVIDGIFEKDRGKDIVVITKVGQLIIDKNEIENIEDLIPPIPDIIFIGHGQEEIFDNYHLFTGKILNQGSRKGDFVRVIYKLWGEDTQIINSDSVFVAGTQVKYKSGVVTDTALAPNQSAYFSVQVSIDDEIPISYVTREIRWLVYD